MRRLFFSLLTAMFSTCLVEAQTLELDRTLAQPPMQLFFPHWYLGVQGGAAYDLGEDEFKNLISPAAQLQIGYQFCKPVAIQLAVSGAWARGRYAFPEARYKWNFVQPTLEVRLDLPTLFAGWDIDRWWDIYALVGGGVAVSFNNDDAEEADKRFGIDFQKLWHNYRINPVVKAGIGADFRVSKYLSINIEANANMLPDHFNSKRGQNDNQDWHFNALAGLRIDLNEPSRRTPPIFEHNEPFIYEPVPEQKPDTVVLVERELPDTVLEVYNIQFEINKSIIRPSQVGKLTKVLKFMHANPKSKIQLTGYADKETGTSEINERLSRERARVVSEYLVEHGLDETRIRRRARGDRIQPYDIPEDNRVTICVIYELIDPETQY